MALSPRRVTGRVLAASAKAATVPVLAAGLRAAARPQLGLDRLRDARLGDVAPDLAPPAPRRPDDPA